MSNFIPKETGGGPEFQVDGEFSAAILKAWDGLIYVCGPDFLIRFMNSRFIETLGRDATGEHCFYALHGRSEPCPWCPREVFEGKSASGVFQKPADGRWYHVLNFPLPLPGGAFGKVAFTRERSEPQTKDLPVFRNIVDHLSDAIFFHAPDDGRILYVNDDACRSLGHSREALMGMQLTDYADTPSPETWRKLIAAIEKEGFAVFEAKHRHKSGTFTDVEVKATQVQAGLDRFIVMVARDITDRKKAEARLVEERNKVEAIMAASGVGITVQDLDFRIIYQNEVLVRRRGRRLGEYCYRVYANRDRICDDCQAQKSIEDGRMHQRPFTTTTPEGESLHLEITACPLRNSTGEVVACVEIVRDVTEQKKLERSREEAFSAVSHEMRTPLTAVLGFAQFMQENTTSPEQQREYLGLIEKEALRLKRLIDNMLGLQRLRAGFGLMNPAPLSLFPLLHEVAGQFRSPLAPRRIEIDCAPDTPPVLGEAIRLLEAVTNLLDNAFKYSPAESAVVLGARADGDRALLWVQDEGPGIPADKQEKIFEQFYRMEESRRAAGTGLGLSLVREIAHAHGGRAWVESAPGRGSTFFMSLPFAP